MDTGTHESLFDASAFVETIERRQGLKVACIEEVAYRMGYIDATQVKKLAISLRENGYGHYLLNMLQYDIRGALKSGNALQRILPLPRCAQSVCGEAASGN